MNLRTCLPFLLLGTLAITRSAFPCSFSAPPDEQAFRKAKVVVVGKILRTEFQGKPIPGVEFRGGQVEATFRTVEVLKGNAPAEGRVWSGVASPGSCSITLTAGNSYLLFLPTPGYVDVTSGSRFIWGLDNPGDKQILDKLRTLKSDNLERDAQQFIPPGPPRQAGELKR